ncbi:MAG TPA: 7-cyano-7-deazaguanine synthase QueC [Chitinispirillaceae bacterium]|nr:7-cyano-7-deazaguanine synthase QueC [Chitinispirillaceae bacterium]
MKKAVVLVSGGLDSATCCGFARKEHFDIYAMSFSYGQRHSVELECARKVSSCFNAVEHKIINIDLRAFGGSSLTADIDVPKNRNVESQKEIPSTYVPARNTIFLSYALGWAEVLGCTDIFIGVNAIDYSGYPDCRPEFIEAFQKMANLATKAGVQNHILKIHTPLISLTKAEIIKAGISMNIDYSITHSCYDPSSDGLACGSCDSCIIRKKGFLDAAVVDPTRYMST